MNCFAHSQLQTDFCPPVFVEGDTRNSSDPEVKTKTHYTQNMINPQKKIYKTLPSPQYVCEQGRTGLLTKIFPSVNLTLPAEIGERLI